MELNSVRPLSEDLIFAVTSLRERADPTLEVMSNSAFGVKKAWMGPSVNGVSDAGVRTNRSLSMGILMSPERTFLHRNITPLPREARDSAYGVEVIRLGKGEHP